MRMVDTPPGSKPPPTMPAETARVTTHNNPALRFHRGHPQNRIAPLSNTHTYRLRCRRRRACPAFLYPHSGSVAPRWRDKRGRSAPSCRISPCLSLYLAPSPVRRSAAAGVGPRADESWQSQQQPGKAEAEADSNMEADKNIGGCIHKIYSNLRMQQIQF